jgi:outer membrane immunogenic protein
MSKRSYLLLAAVIGVGVIFQPHEAEAVAVGQSCSSPGATGMSDDQRDMLACLNGGSGSLVWEQMSIRPQSVTNAPAAPAPSISPSAPLLAQSPNAPRGAQTRWGGWYVGGNVGYAETTASYGNGPNAEGSAYISGGTVDHDIDGSSAGLVGGYNRVTSNGLFYGGEADINYMSNGGNLDISFAPYGSNGGSEFADLRSQWTGYATARGRVGVAFDPALLYLTGGLALAEVKDTFSSIPWGGNNFFESSRILPGWTAGAGAEFALTDNISLSAQYLRLQMAAHYVTMTDNDFAGGAVKFRLDDSADILRVGVNWHFD